MGRTRGNTAPAVGVESSRRQWLMRASRMLTATLPAAGWLCATGLPISLLRADRGALPDKSEEAAKRGCTLGFSTYGMKTVRTEEAIRTLDRIGYDAVELTVRSGWDADSAKLGVARRKALRGLLAQTGIRLTSLMEHVYPSDKARQAIALDRLKRAAELGHALAPQAPPVVQTVLGGGRFEDRKQQLRDYLGAWAEIAKQTRTTIAIKPHRGGVVSKPSEAVWLLEQLGKPLRVRIVYDYSHYAYRDLPLAQTIRTALPYTAHIAVKDAVREGGRVVFKLPGAAGTIDYVQILRAFYRGGYRGDINCEVSGMVWGRKGYDPQAAAKICYRNIAAAFRKAGVPRAKRKE